MAGSVMATTLVGGYTDCNENDLKVQEAAEFAVDEYNKEQEKNLKLVRVLKAQKQIVNGTNYKLFLETKDDDAGYQRYEALVYVKPDDCMELVEFDLLLIGGWIDATSDVGIEDVAKFAVDEYNKKEGTTLVFKKLVKAEKQLVAGILYRLTLEATDDGENMWYLAMVTVIPWEKIKELEEFKPLLLNVEE